MSAAFDHRPGRAKRMLHAVGAALGLLVAASLFLAVPMPSGAAGPEEAFLTGQFLIASPSMGDPRFYHAVILVVHHDKEGALGIVINRPVAAEPMQRLLEELGQQGAKASGTVEVFAGGPVQPNVGFVLHSAEYKSAGTIAIDGHVSMTSNPAVLRDIAGGHGPKKYILAFGYAGWGPGQLEAELAQQAWFTAPDDPQLLFDGDRATLWRNALDRRSRSL